MQKDSFINFHLDLLGDISRSAMKIKENNGYLYKKRKMIYVVKCSQEDCIYLKVNNGYGKKVQNQSKIEVFLDAVTFLQILENFLEIPKLLKKLA